MRILAEQGVDEALFGFDGSMRFGVVGGADKDHDGGQVHPEEQADGGREASVHHVVGHFAHVHAKEHVNDPPHDRRDYGAGKQSHESPMAGTADAIEEHQGDHREQKDGGRLEDDFEVVNQKRLAVLADQIGARLFSEYGQDDHDDRGNNCEQQQQKRAQMYAPVTTTQRIAFDDAETFDEADHDLRAGEKSAAQAEQKPFPGVFAFAHKVLRDDIVAAGRENEFEAFGYFAQRAVERSGAANDAEGEQQHGEKREKHVEGDGLAEGDAVWKDAAESAEEIFEYSIHRGRPRDYTVSDC